MTRRASLLRSGRAATAALVLVGLSCTAAQARPGRRPGGPSGATPAAPVAPDRSRPSTCPPVPADQGGPGTEPESALGTFPWPAPSPSTNPEAYASYLHTPAAQPPVRPANFNDGGGDWKLTSSRSTAPLLAGNPQELCGVMGSRVDAAWQTTTGRPDVVVAVTDSGIEWCRASTIDKVYLNRAALPPPENAAGLTKAQLAAAGQRFADADPYDLNGSGVFNVEQYAHDPRVTKPYFCGTSISARDLIRTFGTPGSPSYYGHSGPAGFTEAIAGWNFVDNNNDPFDDVGYGHGSGEAADSTGAADSKGNGVGTCPDCMVLPVRVGESFVANSADFARGVLFAVDSGVSVIQEALGTIDVTSVAAQAIDYANAHGVPVIASAADEEAEHHNEPANLPGTIVVNSVTQSPSASIGPVTGSLDNPPGYLFLNGCTNYGANVAVSVESGSCSSEATGKTGGVAGLIEAEARNLLEAGKLAARAGVRSVDGRPVALSSTEVRELIEMSADDVDFQTAAPPLGPPDNYAVASPVPTTRYRTQPGYDMFTGYGRLDAGAILSWLAQAKIPPEASFGTMPWFATFDPASSTIEVQASAAAVRTRDKAFRWTLQYGVGTQPEPGAWYTIESGSGHGSAAVTASLGPRQLQAIARQLGHTSLPGAFGPDGKSGSDANAFTLRLVVTDSRGLVGMDRRTEYLHGDPTLMSRVPLDLGSSIDAPPTLAPIAPGGQNALIVATADGDVHAFMPPAPSARGDEAALRLTPSNGKLAELPGWPVHTSFVDDHTAEPAYASGAVTSRPRAGVVGGVAVGDLRGDGHLEVVLADMTGHVYAWDPSGHLLAGYPLRTNPAFSSPSARDGHNRLLAGIESAPALAHLENATQLDIAVSSLDRHVYAWRPDGTPVPGWPVLVVDPGQVQSVDPVTNKVTFLASAHPGQGTQILDTPAIGALTGHGPPDLVVGTGEEYLGAPNVSAADPGNEALGQVPLLNPSNSRVYALAATGTRTGDTACAHGTPQPDACAIVPGWPASIADYDAQLLPDVGDGTTASPALADLAGDGRLEAGVMSAVGPAYILNPDATSYLGNGPDGHPRSLETAPAGPLSNSPAGPSIPALGMPVFAPLGGAAPGISLIAPAASAGKALDAALPDQQRPNDNTLDAWNTTTGHFQPAFPRTMNDLQFFNQPIVAAVAGGGRAYIVEGSATSDVRAYDASGREAPGFPKFTGGWMVNSPSFGPLGALADQVLAAGTRDGYLFVWRTPAAACDPSGPWPREHHDLLNTGNLSSAAHQPVAACRSA